ncbi:MAG: deoxycytidylate deaminase [Candidatus Thiodiazotropha sp. (ex Troendleina suluensis)]|nr:deoxycytidylate deaminase [Candidatus Thiodiazotropha sp. (ex Troendleina suluensis)]
MAGSLSLKTVSASDKKSDSTSTSRKIQDKIQQRQSQEIVIAFSGPVGSGIKSVIEHFEACIKKVGYTAVKIKLSDKIKDAYKILSIDKPDEINERIRNINLDTLSGYERYDKLQDIGNFLRSQYESDILAQYAITDIILHRAEQAKKEYNELVKSKEIDPNETDLATFTIEQFVPSKTVYLIDQLKNPAEVDLLKDVYGDLYYLIGVLCGERERVRNLKGDNVNEREALQVMIRDRKEEERSGQQLEKTLKYSDYFIRNTEADSQHIEEKINRFINVIHDVGVLTPGEDEHAMYIAHSAAMKSACLSRQVGACITNKSGQVLATGCNDVPKFGGGLFCSDDKPDFRCYNKDRKCHNEDYKQHHIREELKGVLEMHKVKNKEQILQSVFEVTRVKDLMEFSRSIHAEMDAITSIARSGSSSTKNCTLYTTTYPCHNCARHIIAAGIDKVIYIEPYEKSLAIELHGEAISSEDEVNNKVAFIHFEGVAPRKYQDFFLSNSDKKNNDGTLKLNELYELKQKIHPYLDSYRTIESKVSEHLKEKGLSNLLASDKQ